MEKVFISFSNKDMAASTKVTAEFQENDTPYWICKENESYGAMYAASIVQAIKACDIFLHFYHRIQTSLNMSQMKSMLL